MAECNGKAICLISYELLLDELQGDRGGACFEAVFVGNRFIKFVLRPPDGPRPARISDCYWIEWALETNPVSIADLQEEARSLANVPSHVDWGLTLVWLLLRPALQNQLSEEPSGAEYTRNSALRDQFNATRLDLGMTEPEVESILKAKPLEQAMIENGLCKIFGSDEKFNIDRRLHFSNVLVVFKDGKVRQVESIGAIDEWRQILADESTK